MVWVYRGNIRNRMVNRETTGPKYLNANNDGSNAWSKEGAVITGLLLLIVVSRRVRTREYTRRHRKSSGWHVCHDTFGGQERHLIGHGWNAILYWMGCSSTPLNRPPWFLQQLLAPILSNLALWTHTLRQTGQCNYFQKKQSVRGGEFSMSMSLLMEMPKNGKAELQVGNM